MVKQDIIPFKHQSDCADFLEKRGYSGAIYADIGCGKTLMALLNYHRAKIKDNSLKLMVICPVSLISATWKTDAEKFTTFTTHSLRERKFQNADIYIINFESVITAKIQAAIIELTKNNRVMVVIDESQRMKNFKSAISKTLLKLAPLFSYRVIMSGCPAPNGYNEYWAQMRFIDPYILSPSHYVFLAEYFHLARGNQVIPGIPRHRAAIRETMSQGFKYAITEEKKHALLEKIRPYCFFANIDDFIDLPPVTKVFREAQMTPALAKVYKELKDTLVTEISGIDIATPIALTKLMKLRELCGGFILTAEGQTLTVDCPKIDVLNEILDEAGTAQVIIWVNFTWEANRIVAELGRDNCAVLNGNITDKDTEIKDFQEGRKQYLVAHPRSGGAGLTFVNCALMVDYSLDYSHDNAVQTQGRFRRPGQKSEHLTRIRIVMKDSIDEIILGVLDGKYQEWEIVRVFMSKEVIGYVK